MRDLTIAEIELTCGAMGSRGYVAPPTPAQTALNNAFAYGVIGGAIAGSGGGFLGMALGAMGGFISSVGGGGFFS